MENKKRSHCYPYHQKAADLCFVNKKHVNELMIFVQRLLLTFVSTFSSCVLYTLGAYDFENC